MLVETLFNQITDVDFYSDRAIPPELTLERMRPHLSNLGITRIADQTNLDKLQIPCFASFRPNSKTLSTNQGKGINPELAKASAVMEAVEYAAAEIPAIFSKSFSINQLSEQSHICCSPNRYLPDECNLSDGKTIQWCKGYTLWSNQPVWVPLDLISLNGAAIDLPGVCQTTNGLASGNTKTEAVFHALCELIERHANTIWVLRSNSARELTCFDPELLADSVVDELIKRIVKSDMQVQLFNQTIDVDVPVMMAVIGERTPYNGYFEVAAGYGAHPSPARAAIRAITEAAQTRITSIAAARDDIAPEKHKEEMSAAAKAILAIEPNPNPMLPSEPSTKLNVEELLNSVINRMKKANLDEPVVVELTNNLPCSVVRMLSSDLEDFEANINWRIGKRAEAWIGQ